MKQVFMGLLMSVIMIASPMAGCLSVDGIEDLIDDLESFGECIVYYDGVEQAKITYNSDLRNQSLNSTDNSSNSTDNSSNSTDNSSNSTDNSSNSTDIDWDISFYDARNETLELDCEAQGFVYLDLTDDDVEEDETSRPAEDDSIESCEESNGTASENTTECESESHNTESGNETHPCNQDNATGCED